MSLPAGTRLGPYEIIARLGAGGMGEVYRARDTRLRRDVAVKVLAASFVGDAERLRRFEHEAEAAGRLNHPNILAVHDVGAHDGVPYIVCELLEGRTLRELLAGGALPVAAALEHAAGMAAGLAAAHDKGIVHRDLKPENVFITRDGLVKILDFGLVKMREEPHPESDAGGDTGGGAHPSQLDTASAGMTVSGRIVGTAAYMSPEQARGKPVDERTDIWSFGCVVYEMLAGRHAFTGDTVSDLLAAILTSEPDWKALPAETPSSVRTLLRHCLEKDVEKRTPRAAEIAPALIQTRGALAMQGGAAAGGPLRLVVPLAAVALLGLLALYGVSRLRNEGAAPQRGAPTTMRQATFNEGIEQFPAWSPGGDRIAYAADAGAVRKIFVREVDGGDGEAITTGDADDIQPSWSPDGAAILFVRAGTPGRRLEPGDVFGCYTGGDVWQIDVATRRQTPVVENAFNPCWSPDGQRIAAEASWAGPRRLWVLDKMGRNPQQVTTDVSEEIEHLRPRWSPDGRKLVFQVLERTKFDVRVVDVETKRLTAVTDDPVQDIEPSWSPSGRYIYFSSYRSGGMNLWRAPVTESGAPSGPLQQVTTGAGQDVEAALSPDGRRIAFSILRQNADIWKIPVEPTTGRPSGTPAEMIATTREDSRGAWSPDGATVAFNSDRTGDMNIWLMTVATGATRQLTRGPGGDFQPTWSPDGRRIVFFSSRSGNVDVWTADVATGALKQLTTSGAIDVNPFYSPDGSRIAYQSDQGGRLEVWVMKADGGAPTQLTRVGVGGHFLRWTPDGAGIVFRCLCGGNPQTMVVPAAGGEPRFFADVAGGSHMSFSPDFRLIMDTVGHKSLWVSPVPAGSAPAAGTPENVFTFESPEVRIDYPVWSPDGRWVLVDRFRPQGGDIWVMDGADRN